MPDQPATPRRPDPPAAIADSPVPDDALAVVRPGDPDPLLGRVGGCGFSWWDHLDDPCEDPPWRCHREPGHLGQHIATDPGFHVAAVHPGPPYLTNRSPASPKAH